MANKQLNLMFNHAKSLGKFAEYQDFSEFQKKHLGIGADPKKTYRQWLAGLEPKEREDYLECFGK